jgi:uncharacterized protein YhbP (UPF0306 family)
MKQMAMDFMKANYHCVISTIGPNNKPQSALVGFSENAKLELVIATTTDSRKHKNLSINHNVSVVIGSGDKKIAIQYEGIATQLTGSELEQGLKQHFKKIPSAAKYKNNNLQIYYKIKPSWIRYVDINNGPPQFEEIKLT